MDNQQEQPRKRPSGRKRGRTLRRDSLAESRSPACRWTLSRSSLQIGRWFLDFLCPELLHASAGLRPSRQVVVPGMRSPNPSSIGYCPPCVAPHLDTVPVLEHLGPTAASRPRPPVLCLLSLDC